MLRFTCLVKAEVAFHTCYHLSQKHDDPCSSLLSSSVWQSKKCYSSISDCLSLLERNMARSQALVWCTVFQQMIWWQWAQLLWRNQHGLTEVVPWGDLVLLADRLRGSGAEIWMPLWVVVQHITLINHLNASFSGPLAWTHAQNKEIESHLNQGCRAELT